MADRPVRRHLSGRLPPDALEMLARDFAQSGPVSQSLPYETLRPDIGALELDFVHTLNAVRAERLKPGAQDEAAGDWHGFSGTSFPPLTSAYQPLTTELLPLSTSFQPSSLAHEIPQLRLDIPPAQDLMHGERTSPDHIKPLSIDEPFSLSAEPPNKDADAAQPQAEKKKKRSKPWRRRRDLILPAGTRKKNREAQQRFRMKQKERKQEMSDELDQLRDENAALHTRIAQLEKQVLELGGEVESEMSPVSHRSSENAQTP